MEERRVREFVLQTERSVALFGLLDGELAAQLRFALWEASAISDIDKIPDG